MAFQQVPLTTRCELVYSYKGQLAMNVLHYKSLDAATADDLEAFAEEMVSQWTTFLRPITHEDASLVAVRATSLDSEFAPGIEYTTGLPLAGSVTGTGLPSNVTVAVRFLTALRGRSYRGRAFQIGMGSTQIVDGDNEISTAYQTALRNAWIGLQSIESDPVFAQCIVSRVSGGEPRVTGVATDVTGVAVDIVLDSQRRRLHGRGA